jgi:hypothetical protein
VSVAVAIRFSFISCDKKATRQGGFFSREAQRFALEDKPAGPRRGWAGAVAWRCSSHSPVAGRRCCAPAAVPFNARSPLGLGLGGLRNDFPQKQRHFPFADAKIGGQDLEGAHDQRERFLDRRRPAAGDDVLREGGRGPTPKDGWCSPTHFGT